MDVDPYLQRFHAEFVDPDNAAFFLDKESESGYVWPVERISTEDGVFELFENELSDEERDELASDLNGSYPYWARRTDVDRISTVE